MGEFELIQRYFSRHKRLSRRDILQSVGDDCAVLQIPAHHHLAVSTDTLVLNTHFLPTISPSDLAYKAVMVNLSDLAAMGAKPAWASLALTLPDVDESWLSAFSESLFHTLDAHQVALIGGDTTKGTLSLTLTVQGFLPENRGLYRHQAKAGDAVFVTGTLGDSAAGLDLLLHPTDNCHHEEQQYLQARHLRPTARVAFGQALTAYSQCAADISDGLLADLGHILTASQCGAEIWVEKLPLSQPLCTSYSAEQAEQFALCGGEDYELCFTVPQPYIPAIIELAARHQLACHHIGTITGTPGLTLLKHHKPYPIPEKAGFNHFKL